MPQVRETPSRGRTTRCALAGALAVALVGCGSGNSLEGSLTDVVDLSFTDVEASTTDKSVIVVYYRPQGEGRDVVFKLVVFIAPGDVIPGQPFDLAPAPDGTRVAEASRSVANDPVHSYPPVKVGTVTYEEIPTLDQPLSGSWRVTFGDGGDAGRGRTAFGTFKAKRVVFGQ